MFARRIPPERRLADPQAEKTYKKLKEAYDLLCDPAVRKAAGPQPTPDRIELAPEEEPVLKPGEEFNFRRFSGWVGLAFGGAAIVVGFLNAYSESGGLITGLLGLPPILDEDERLGWFMMMIAGLAYSFWSAGRFMITDKEYADEWRRGIRQGRLRWPI